MNCVQWLLEPFSRHIAVIYGVEVLLETSPVASLDRLCLQCTHNVPKNHRKTSRKSLRSPLRRRVWWLGSKRCTRSTGTCWFLFTLSRLPDGWAASTIYPRGKFEFGDFVDMGVAKGCRTRGKSLSLNSYFVIF